MITLNSLKKLLSYDPYTGIFIWITYDHNHMKRAGTINEYGYRRICINGKLYREHILAWFYMTNHYPKHPYEQIDHINRIKDDNKFSNLRLVNQSVNLHNAKLRSDNTSKCKGVTGSILKGWRAGITINGKSIYLGKYSKYDDAVEARKNAEKFYEI